jgi:GNAT superfamily N-acetyltransferase
MYEVVDAVPTPEDYVRLRLAAGLSGRSVEAARRGVPQTRAGALAKTGDERVVAMGRLIGDGALFLQVVDRAVEPEHQRCGLGGRMLAPLLERARREAPEAYVSLIADPKGHGMYVRHGFVDVDPSLGMKWQATTAAQ